MSIQTKAAAPTMETAALSLNRHVEPTTSPARSKVRLRCERLLVGHLGRGGFEEFLRQRQPALGDRTGQDLLENAPDLLLERLEELERGGA